MAQPAIDARAVRLQLALLYGAAFGLSALVLAFPLTRELIQADGRFRVREFFCFDNTWRPTLRALAARANVVLMDLRGFTRANAGCVFELEQLNALSAIGRCVFVVDASTDRTLVEASLGVASSAQQPQWIMMKREAAAIPRLWRELVQRAGIAPAAA